MSRADPQEAKVLVIGASGSIGSATATALAQKGRTVGLHYFNNRDKVVNLRHRFERMGLKSVILASQLASAQDCHQLLDEFSQLPEPFYGLAICSGRVPWIPWHELTVDDWQNVIFEHCILPYLLAQIAAERLIKGGRIVYLSSISPKYGGSPQTVHYAAAKAGLETAMLGLAKQLAARKIRVNGVRAGFVDTPQQRLGRTSEEIQKRVDKIPLRRAGKADEVASAFAYLFSEGAAFITGEFITVAGGD